jgi:hypothetical protein
MGDFEPKEEIVGTGCWDLALGEPDQCFGSGSRQAQERKIWLHDNAVDLDSC